MTTQHGTEATQHNNNMVATQHGANIIGLRQQPKGQEGRDNNIYVETTIYHTKQLQLSVIHMAAEDTECTLSNVTL